MNPNRNTVKRGVEFCILLIMQIITGTYAGSQESTSPPTTLETVILTPDRSVYLPGDDILIVARVAEADTYITSDLSMIIRIEITGSDGTVIAREKLAAESGLAECIISLPEAIPTGWYQISAYTNWMRNFSQDFYSTARIRIIDPADLEDIESDKSAVPVIVTLFSEGNTAMRQGSENQIAVYVKDISGNPVSFRGSVLSASGDTVATISTGKTGWGITSIAPDKDGSLSIVAESDKITVKQYVIPPTGLAAPRLQIKPSKSNIRVIADIPGSGNRSYRLIVHSLYTWYWFREISASNDATEYSVPVSSLPSSGIYQFTLLDDNGRIIAARLWASDDMGAADGYIETIADSVSQRSEINTSWIADGTGSAGSYRVIARRKEPLENGDIYIPGLPGWPCTGIIPKDNTEREAWLMANTYPPGVVNQFFENRETGEPAERIINFRDPIHVRETMVAYLPEIRGMVVSGEIKASDTGEPVNGETLTLTTFSDKYIYTAVTYPSGRFHFTIPYMAGDDDAIISYLRKPENSLSLTVYSDFDESTEPGIPDKVILYAGEAEYIRQLNIEKRLREIFNIGKDSLLSDEHKSTDKNYRSVLGYPDYSVHVDDFIRLPNIREVIAEVVPTVIARRSGDNWSLRLVNEQSTREKMLPLITLDGLPLTNFNDFLLLPPERITRIDVFNRIYIRGNASFGGVVSFTSRNNDLAGLRLPEEARIITLDLPESRQFILPTPSPPNVPYLQVVLGLKTVNNESNGIFTFRCGDNTGDFIYILSGFTKEGAWVYLTDTFAISGNRKDQ